MKKILWLPVCVLLVLASCSKKIQPTVTKPAKKDTVTAPVSTKTEPVTEPPIPEITIPEKTSPVIPAAPFSSPMIVIDEAGNVITTRDKLPPELAGKVDYKKITRAFTPAQRQNLIGRFKMVPPKVLFIPEELASKSARGTYIVYKKKFWYWKKEDGLFHLDETYYQ
jgi:hypothetical protein